MKSLFCLLLLLPWLSAAQLLNLEAIDIQHYNFSLELNDSTDVISGKAEISILSRKPVNDAEFDLINKTGDGKGMVVSDVKLNEKSIKFMHRGDRIKIQFAEQVPSGKRIIVTVFYSGIPKDGLIISAISRINVCSIPLSNIFKVS